MILRASVYRPADRSGRPIKTKTPVLVEPHPYSKLIFSMAGEAASNPVLWPLLEQIVASVNLTGTPSRAPNNSSGSSGRGHRHQRCRPPPRPFWVTRRSSSTSAAPGWSQGVWDVFFQAREQQDTLEVIDWAARQPWSNGKVRMTGGSWPSGIQRIYAASKNPEHLKAIFPVVSRRRPGALDRRTGRCRRDRLPPDVADRRRSLKDDPQRRSMLNGDLRLKVARLPRPRPRGVLPTAHRGADQPEYQTTVAASGRAGRPEQLDPTRLPWTADRSASRRFILGGWFDIFTYDELRMYTNCRKLPPGEAAVHGPTYREHGLQMGGAGQPPRIDVP